MFLKLYLSLLPLFFISLFLSFCVYWFLSFLFFFSLTDTISQSHSSQTKKPFSNTTHDIFNTLVSGGSNSNLDPTPEDLDYIGETSSAYTSGPDVDYDSYDSDGDNSFHAAEGLDLDELGQGNATIVSAPKDLKAVIVKHRFVTLSWEEPERKVEDITGYAVVYKVKGSERYVIL